MAQIEKTQIDTDENYSERYFRAARIRSPDSDPKESEATLEPGPKNLGSSVSICGFPLHGHGLSPRQSCCEEMQSTIREAKRALRERVSAVLKRIEAGERAAASAQARCLLAAQIRWRTAQWVLFFAPLPEELDVWPLLAEALSAGKKVALPRFVAETGSYEARQILDPRY